MTPLQTLKQLKQEEQRKLYPNVPDHGMKPVKYEDKTANGLTKCILDFLNLSGHFAERTGNEGRVIDGRKAYTDVLGRQKTIGTVKRIPSSGVKGTSDVKSVINGKMVAIEIKTGLDRQSEAQKAYQKRVEQAGGVYWIVKSFDDFYQKYTEFLSKFL
jgi:hypothetical protein